MLSLLVCPDVGGHEWQYTGAIPPSLGTVTSELHNLTLVRSVSGCGV